MSGRPIKIRSVRVPWAPNAPRIEVDHYAIRVYFGDALHLHVDRSAYLGLQAWSDGPNDYSIEFSLRENSALLVEYDNAEKWLAILKLLDGVL